MIYDVIVVGSGIAGLMAAIEAKDENNKVALISKSNVFKSNSSMASGGINAVLDINNTDEINKHIQDTFNSAKGLGNKKAITYMCKQASTIIEKLIEYGVDFDRDENNKILQRPFGGGSSNRTCYVGDKTGSAITLSLIKKAKTMGITFLPNNFILNLAKYQDRVSGVVSLNKETSQVMIYSSKSVVLAGGGYAGIYRGYSTNAPDYTGDLLAVALRAGLYLKDMEFVQFHPTALYKPGIHPSFLVTEAMRGYGGILKTKDGKVIITDKEYVTYFGEVGEFKKLVFDAAARAGYGRIKEVAVIGDGAHWIWNMCEELFPDAVQILDYYHLSENVHKFGRFLYPENDIEMKRWSKNILNKIDKGQIDEVIGGLPDIKGKKLPVQTPNLKVYLDNNRKRIDYKDYKEKGYYVGSGAIESGNKLVIQQRMKQSGMRWSVPGGQQIAALRAKYSSDKWDVVQDVIGL